MKQKVETPKVEALNARFWLSFTKGLIDIMDDYQGKIESEYIEGPEDEARLRSNLVKMVKMLETKVTPEEDDPMMHHYLTRKDVYAYHAFAFQALGDENPILEPFWDEFGYELYDLWQTYFLLFDDRKELVDPKELEWE